jgi:hypothetical protein
MEFNIQKRMLAGRTLYMSGHLSYKPTAPDSTSGSPAQIRGGHIRVQWVSGWNFTEDAPEANSSLLHSSKV